MESTFEIKIANHTCWLAYATQYQTDAELAFFKTVNQHARFAKSIPPSRALIPVY